MASEKRTSRDWYNEIKDKIVLCDPDGWRRLNQTYFSSTPITEDEFKRRLSKSSCIFKDMAFVNGYFQ